MYPERLVDYRKTTRMTATSTNDFKVVLLKEKTKSLLLLQKFKEEFLSSLARLNSVDVIAIEERLQDIEWFVEEKYKEIESRAERVGLN